MKVFLVYLLSFCLSLNAEAYTSTDDSLLILNLDKGIMLIDNHKTSSEITYNFARLDLKTGPDEKVMQKILRKGANATPSATAKDVEEIYNTMSKALSGKDFYFTPLINLPQSSSPLYAWMTTTTSKTDLMKTITIWIDADSATLYMVMYMIKKDLTTTKWNAAIAKFKSSIQICYATKKCYNLH